MLKSHEEEFNKKTYVNLIMASVLSGAALAVMPSVAGWLLNTDITNPTGLDLPSGLTDIVAKGLGLLRYIGVVVIVAGVGVGVIAIRLEPETSAKT